MERPEIIKVFNYHYAVKDAPGRYSDAANAYGWYDPERETIYLCKTLTGSREREVLLHEVLHALAKALQLDKAPEEDLCTRLAAGLMTVFIDNPQLTQWLFELSSSDS